MSVTEFFVRGDFFFMFVLTVLLALVFLSAWKAPAWVKGIGRIAAVAGIVFGLIGLYLMFGTLSEHDDISLNVAYAGYQVTLIPVIYGLVIDIVAIAIRLFHKPRA